jgi:hypothetical protein
MLLAGWTQHIVPALLFEQDAERVVFAPDLLDTVIATASCVAATIVCGLVPIFANPADQPEAVLRRESAGPSKTMGRFCAGLAVAQMMSVCVLVVSTSLLLDALRAAVQTSVGRRLGNPLLVTVQAELPPNQTQVDIRYFHHVQRAVQSMAGFSATGWAAQLPGSQPMWRPFRIEPLHLPRREVTLDVAWFTPDSLKLFNLPPRAGRLFGFEDQTCRVAIVNEDAAAQLFGRDTVGRTIQEPAWYPVEIIGIVAEKFQHARGRPTIYYNDVPGTPPAPAAGARFHAPVTSELPGAELGVNVVSQGYFGALGASVMAGRMFDEHACPASAVSP